MVFSRRIILRIIPWLTDYPLHRDEALYGYWARLIASGRDPLLLTPWVDKPPLVLYLLAADVRAFGASELALRLPGMIASLLLVLVTFGFARRAYGVRVALAAARSADPLPVRHPVCADGLHRSVADPVAGRGRLGCAGPPSVSRRAAARAGRRQQTAGRAGRAAGVRAADRRRGPSGRWQMAEEIEVLAHTSAPPLLCSSAPSSASRSIFAPVTYWDSLRWVNRPSFWDRSVTTYGPLALAPLAEWPQRAADWATQIGYLFGLPVLSGLMLLIAAAVGVRAILALYAPRRVQSKECHHHQQFPKWQRQECHSERVYSSTPVTANLQRRIS